MTPGRVSLLVALCAATLADTEVRAQGARPEGALPQVSVPSARYALLIAVNEYPVGIPSLKGAPANDVALAYELLVGRLGIPDSNVRVLRDRDVTRERVRELVATHLGKAGPSDLALLYFTGHGLRLEGNIGLAEADDPEADDRDEALLVWGSDSTRAGVLLDEEIGVLLDALSAGRTLAIIDACNAGTATRAGEPSPMLWRAFGRAPAPRLSAARPNDVAFIAKRVRWADDAPIIELPAQLFSAGVRPSPREHGVLAASQEDETAFAGPLSMPDGSRRSASLFTVALYHALWSAPSTERVDSLMSRVQRSVEARTREVLGVAQRPRVSGDVLTLELRQAGLARSAPRQTRRRPGGAAPMSGQLPPR